MSEASPETPAPTAATAALMARRFRGYLPVAIDVETGGFHPATDALLEIAAVLIDMAEDGSLKRGATHDFHVQPFAGARLDPAALSITGIDPHHPLRPALPERDALQRVFRVIRHAVRAGRACPGGAGRPGAAARDGFSITLGRRERGRRGLRRAPRRREGAPAPKAQPAAPTSVRSFFSSPLRYISSAMSQPPTSSPFT